MSDKPSRQVVTRTGSARIGDRVAIVTGASRGIGAAIAGRLAAEGASVAVVARSREGDDKRHLDGTIDQTVADIRAAGGRAVAIAADLSSAADRDALVGRTEELLGPVDILVNNAAVTFFTPVAEMSARRLDLMLDVQAKAPFLLAQRVLPGMIERRRGSILNISSLAAVHPAGPPYAEQLLDVGYGMCKAALERFTTGLAAEVYEARIGVNCLTPDGIVPTPGVLFHNMLEGLEHLEEPMDRMVEAAIRLIGADPSLVTGRLELSSNAEKLPALEPATVGASIALDDLTV